MPDAPKGLDEAIRRMEEVRARRKAQKRRWGEGLLKESTQKRQEPPETGENWWSKDRD